MPHSPAEKKRAVTRLRRIRGQAEALEKVIEAGASCGDVLQQLAAMRGGISGLMADVLEGHVRERFGHADCGAVCDDPTHLHAQIDEVAQLMRSYLK